MNKHISDDLVKINQRAENTLIKNLGIEYTKVEEGLVEGTMPVDHRTVQPFGFLHGGASLAFAETLAGIGSLFCCKENELSVGMQVSGNHVGAISKDNIVKGVAKLIHKGQKTHVWNVDITSMGGRLISSIRVTNCIIER